MAVPSEPPRDTLVTFLPPRCAPWPAGVLMETDASTDHSRTPRTAWPYDATRDAGLAQVDSGGGYRSCRQWWTDGDQGLRSRLLAQVDPDLLTRVGR